MSVTTKPPASDATRSAAAPAGRSPLEPSVRPSRAPPAVPGAPVAVAPPRAPLDAAAALRILVAEVRAAVIEELAAAARLSLPALIDADPGNAGAALLRWLRTAAALSAAAPETLVAAVERGYLRALDGLAAGDRLAPLEEQLGLARDVVLGGLVGAGARPPRADPGTPAVPLYRPDVPAAARPRRATADPRADGSGDEPAGDALAGEAAGADARDAFEAGRRFFAALRSGDGRAFAASWAYPAAVWAGGRWTGFESAADCERGYPAFIATLGAAGLLPSEVVTLAVEPLGASAALLHARLARGGSPGTGSGEYPSVLTALETAGGWRIAVWLLP